MFRHSVYYKISWGYGDILVLIEGEENAVMMPSGVSLRCTIASVMCLRRVPWNIKI